MKYLKIIILIIFFLSTTSLSFSQPLMMMKQWKGKSPCFKIEDLNLSQEQLKGFRLIKQNYIHEIRSLRTQLLSKRMELREFLTNPHISGEALREKTFEIVDLQSKIEEKTFEYLIKMRNLLTEDQIQRWCPELEFPLFREMMMHRMGSMPHRGFGEEYK